MSTIALNRNKKIEPIIAAGILVWGTGTFLLGYYNFFQNSPSFLFGFCIVFLQTALIFSYLLHNTFNKYCNSIPLSTIAILHVWRIFAGWIFIANASSLPRTFVTNAAYGDIIAGCLAVSVFIFRRTKIAYVIFNIVGLADFIVAVVTGLLIFTANPETTNLLSQLPLIIIPLFGVPISGFTHVVSLTRLFKMRDKNWLDNVD